MLYQKGRYRVEVGRDGAILVKPGDWLSKYSAAIYNNFTTIHIFARRDKSGSPVPIKDVNMIYAGETLYHLPTYYSSFSPTEIKVRRPTPPPQPPISDAQKKQMILDALKKDFNLRGDNLPILSTSIDILGYTENAIGLAEIAGLVAEGGAIATVGTALSIAGVFLGMVGNVIAVINAWEFGQRLSGMRAIAYGTTAWAFGDQMPAFPQKLRYNIQYAGDPGGQTAKAHERAWNDARDSAVKNMEEEVRKRRIEKKSLQVLWQAAGGRNRNNLVKELMKGLETKLRKGMERDAFWSPAPDYPN